ncbi:MAG TPA: hypothetical protein VGC34_13730, partial [Steroidobacteraceae bacterium]
EYQQYVADPQEDAVGFYGVVEESGNGAIFALRMKIHRHHIVEAETMVARKRPNEEFPNPDGLKNKPVFDEILPPEARKSREQLATVANSYFETVQQNDGTVYVPLDKRCHRIENGVATTNNKEEAEGSGNSMPSKGCLEQFQSGNFIFVTTIRARRFMVIDQERGLVLTSGFFDHAGGTRSVTLTTGKVQKIGPPFDTPYSFMFFELFKVDAGKLRQVESVLEDVPYRMPTPWEHRSRIEHRELESHSSCDRACLDGFTDQYLAALKARDGGRLPWAQGAVFTENNVALRIGQGLWDTVDGIGRNGQHFADVTAGQAGFLGTVQEDGQSFAFALRLRIDGGRIADAETLVARNFQGPAPAAPDPTFVARLPAEARSTRDKMTRIADAHYATVAGDTTRVRNRRAPLVDEELGVVWTAAFYDIAGTGRSASTPKGATGPAGMTRPWTWQAVDLFKIANGKISKTVEARLQAPYGSHDEWVDQ